MHGPLVTHERLWLRAGNIVREIGLNERQSSAWSEAKACLSHVVGNLFFNMPRAAINKNDGFGGGTVIEHNMITNTCRESGDHGNFVSTRDPSPSLASLAHLILQPVSVMRYRCAQNSWDRQPFLTEVGSGSPSIIPAYLEIRENFLISNCKDRHTFRDLTARQ